ncbi:10658_t:CDS:10 [Diversispora eburnea]|uniref:10658_t:CDS:1 n=1 Tax=Diversispora eburnea TaxID=1213867 RepID=A0A9N9AP81_9GLOM|nr:10658_t:CDS:10 [Diversispora eburnea]
MQDILESLRKISAFCPKEEGKEYINHIDGNSTNNKASNLEWVNQKENNQHGVHLRLGNQRVVKQFFNNGFSRKFSSLAEAQHITGIDKSNIGNVCKGRLIRVGGCHWNKNYILPIPYRLYLRVTCELNNELFTLSVVQSITNPLQPGFVCTCKEKRPTIMGFYNNNIVEKLVEDVIFFPIFINVESFLIVITSIGYSDNNEFNGAGSEFSSSIITKFRGKLSIILQQIKNNVCILDIYQESKKNIQYQDETPNNVWKKSRINKKFDGNDLFGITHPIIQSILQQPSNNRHICTPNEWNNFDILQQAFDYHIKPRKITTTILLDWKKLFDDELRACKAIFKSCRCSDVTSFEKDISDIEFWNRAIDPIVLKNNKRGIDGKIRILSIIADKFCYKDLREKLQVGSTSINSARKHARLNGPGASPISKPQQTLISIWKVAIDHGNQMNDKNTEDAIDHDDQINNKNMEAVFKEQATEAALRKFDLARHRLLAIDRKEGSQEVNRMGIIIDKEISQETYLKFCLNEPRISVNYCLIDGKIEVYEMPTKPHAIVQGELIYLMRSWSNQLQVLVENDIVVNTRSVYRCDACVEPINRQLPQPTQAGQSYPTLVVEIGNVESVNSLHRKVAGYFSPRTAIQVYLTIKLFPRHQNNTVALLAMLYLRNNQIPVIVKSFETAGLHISVLNYLRNTINVPANIITGVGFGAGPCNAPNIQDYQVAIPTNLLFDGVPGGVLVGLPANFNIDLFNLQTVYLRTIALN